MYIHINFKKAYFNMVMYFLHQKKLFLIYLLLSNLFICLYIIILNKFLQHTFINSLKVIISLFMCDLVCIYITTNK
jgi:hypothetical protein